MPMTNDPHFTSAAEELRGLGRWLDSQRESFLDSFNLDELFCLWRAWKRSEWIFTPDQWSERQVAEALLGIPPKWNDREEPIYHGSSSEEDPHAMP